MLGYRHDRHLDVRLNINNVLDKHYWGKLGDSVAYPNGQYGAPRNFMLTAKYSF
jgi:outer membrane receptor for ferric coprogen and ferric-rhodotorulic acid